jgi:phosphatidylserine decarboxylase
MLALGSLANVARHEDVNFLLTNRIPRRFVSRLVASVSRIQHRGLARVLIAVWQRFDRSLDFSEAETTSFDSVHACFTRRLRPGARPVERNPAVVVSPSDGIVGAMGMLNDTQLFQTKGFPYRLEDLLIDPALVEKHRNGRYVTLRLTSGMYHRFHAPADGQVAEVQYIAGDTWNVNPIALRRIERLFCRNERAVLDYALDLPEHALPAALTLVPVAAILVAGIALEGLSIVLTPEYRGPHRLPWNRRFLKGEEMGHFEHGSTILVFASGGLEFAPGLHDGLTIRAGEALFCHSNPPSTGISLPEVK